MIKKMLQDNAALFNEANNLRSSTEMPSPIRNKGWKELKNKIDKYDARILFLEGQHQAMIKKLASDNNIVKSFLPYITDKDKDIKREAFFIITESQNKTCIRQMVKNTLPFSVNESSTLYSRMGFISVDAFRVLFDVVEEIGFEQPQNHSNLTLHILSYIRVYKLTDLMKKFTTLASFSTRLQRIILSELPFFEEFKDIVLNAYKNKHPYYYSHGELESSYAAVAFFLYQEEKMALRVLRNKDAIIGQYSIIRDLVTLGDKDDGLFIANALNEAINSGSWKRMGIKDKSRWLYMKLDEAFDISNPLLLENVIDLFRITIKHSMYDDELIGLLHEMLMAQFGELDIPYCTELEKKVDEIDLMPTCWHQHPKTDMRKKFLRLKEPYSYQRSVLFTLLNKARPLGSSFDHVKFMVATGERFPLNNFGYYGTLKPQVERWLDYFEDNNEKFEPGRWVRYGRYVDVPYKPIGLDSI